MGRERTRGGEAATRVILSTFRASGIFLEAGDRLTEDEGLTSARWQVLGAIAVAERPLTVPQIARRMGLTRQSVHATANRLIEDGLLEQIPNADHRRSSLLDLTESGRAVYAAVDLRQAEWVNLLARRIPLADLETAARVLDELSRQLSEGGLDGASAPAREGAR